VVAFSGVAGMEWVKPVRRSRLAGVVKSLVGERGEVGVVMKEDDVWNVEIVAHGEVANGSAKANGDAEESEEPLEESEGADALECAFKWAVRRACADLKIGNGPADTGDKCERGTVPKVVVTGSLYVVSDAYRLLGRIVDC